MIRIIYWLMLWSGIGISLHVQCFWIFIQNTYQVNTYHVNTWTLIKWTLTIHTKRWLDSDREVKEVYSSDFSLKEITSLSDQWDMHIWNSWSATLHFLLASTPCMSIRLLLLCFLVNVNAFYTLFYLWVTTQAVN